MREGKPIQYIGGEEFGTGAGEALKNIRADNLVVLGRSEGHHRPRPEPLCHVLRAIHGPRNRQLQGEIEGCRAV